MRALTIGVAKALLSFLAAVFVWSGPAWAQAEALRGVALVVGQSKYEHLAPLANPANDADAVADLLTGLGFDTTIATDRSARQLSRILEGFIEDAADADVAILYYAGHGIEAGGENYLVPVDADLTALDAAGERLVPISAYLDRLKASVPVTILMLDACRDNPFPAGAVVRAATGAVPVAMGEAGLGETRGATRLGDAAPGRETYGTVIAFAAEPGRAALDGEPGANSPYTAAVLRHLDAMAGEEFGTVMRMVAAEVYLKTGGRQQPWVNESLRRLLYFGSRPDPVAGPEGAMLAERRGLLLTVAELPSPERTRVERIAGSRGVPMDAVYGLLAALGAALPATDPGRLEDLLVAEAERLAEVLAARQAIETPDPEIARLTRLADEAEGEGLFSSARALRNDAKARFEMMRPAYEAAQAPVAARYAEGAAVYARSAATRALAFDHLGAADDYGQAFALVDGHDAALALSYRRQQALALIDRAYYVPGREAFAAAVEVARDAVRRAEGMDGAERASSLNALGRALQLAGNEAAGVTLLREAETAYREAVALRSAGPDRAEWATSMSNLGFTLRAIGEREADPETLRASAETFREALAVRARDADPARWAHTSLGLAGALFRLGEREAGVASFEQAAAIYRDALAALDPESQPHRTAVAHGGLGDTLHKTGERTGDLALFDEALASYDAGLRLVDRDRQASLWSYLTQNRATALLALGRARYDADALRQALAGLREVEAALPAAGQELMLAANRVAQADALAWIGRTGHDPAPLGEAAGIYRRAAASLARADHPLFWAGIHNSLGNALEASGRLTRDAPSLAAAAAAFRAALEEMTHERSPLDFAMASLNLANVLRAAAELSGDASALPEARAAIEAALAEYSAAGTPLQFASAANTAGTVLRTQGILSDDLGPIVESAAMFRQALAVWTAEDHPHQRAIAADNLATTLAIVGRSTGDRAALSEALATFRTARDLYAKAGATPSAEGLAPEIAALEAEVGK